MKQLTELQIIDIINDVLEENILCENNKHMSFQELGIESIIFIRIIVELEDYFECEFPDSKLIYSELDSVEKIYNTLKVLLESKKL